MDMKPQELRIGNLIYDHNSAVRPVGYVGETIGLDLGDGCTQRYQKNPMFSGDINDLKPIPLTEQWLKDFKIPKNQFGNYVLLDGEIWFYYNGEEWAFNIAGYTIYLQYVHQFQNLVFALIGKELIK